MRKILLYTKKARKKKMVVLKLKKKEKPKKRTRIITIEKKDDESESGLTWIKKNLKAKHLENLKTVLKHSNATPIKKYGCIGYTCIYCDIQYTDPLCLKQHSLEKHKNEIDSIYENHKKPIPHFKIDVTNLKCSICNEPYNDLNQFIDHLVMDHKRSYNSDVPSHMIPFKFDSELPKCYICKNEFSTFKRLLVHMNSHFENFVCDVCGKGFIAKSILQTHMMRHRTGLFKCHICDKDFDTSVKQKDHTRAVHIMLNKRNRCGYCGEKFGDYTKKNEHVVKVHGGKILVLQCKSCDKTFDNQRALSAHIKKYHSVDPRKLNI